MKNTLLPLLTILGIAAALLGVASSAVLAQDGQADTSSSQDSGQSFFSGGAQSQPDFSASATAAGETGAGLEGTFGASTSDASSALTGPTAGSSAVSPSDLVTALVAIGAVAALSDSLLSSGSSGMGNSNFFYPNHHLPPMRPVPEGSTRLDFGVFALLAVLVLARRRKKALAR